MAELIINALIRTIFILIAFLLIFVISPIIGSFMTGVIFFGFDGVWDAVVYLWDLHWALPGAVVVGLGLVGFFMFFHVLGSIIAGIFGN